MTLMCKSVAYKQELRIEALVGVTIDSKEVILVGFNELLNHDDDGGLKNKSSDESKTSSSSSIVKSGQGKDLTNSRQTTQTAIKRCHQSKFSNNAKVNKSVKTDQVGDVIICEERPSPKRHLADKHGKTSKTHHKDDDLIYVGKESYSLVTGNFVKEEQSPIETVITGRKKKRKVVPSQTKPRIQNSQITSQAVTLPSASVGLNTQAAVTTFSGPQPKLVGIPKKTRRSKSVRYVVSDGVNGSHVAPIRQSNGSAEDHDVYILTSAPDLSPITVTPTSRIQCSQSDIKTHTMSSASTVRQSHVAMSTPVRDSTHVSWMTPVAHAMTGSQQTSVSHVTHLREAASASQVGTVSPESFLVLSSGGMVDPINISPRNSLATHTIISATSKEPLMPNLIPISTTPMAMPVSQTDHVTKSTSPLSHTDPVTMSSAPISQMDPVTMSTTPVSQTDHFAMSSAPISQMDPVTMFSAPINQRGPVTMSTAPVSQTDPVTMSTSVYQPALDSQGDPITISMLDNQSTPFSISEPISQSVPFTMSASINQSVPVSMSVSVNEATSSPQQSLIPTTVSTERECALVSIGTNSYH